MSSYSKRKCQCGAFSLPGIKRLFFLKAKVTGAAYKSMLQGNTVPSIISFFGGRMLV
jgi:hypothetical protein